MTYCDISQVTAVGVDCDRGIWIGLGVTLLVGLVALSCTCGCYWERINTFLRPERAADGGKSPELAELANEKADAAPPLMLRVVSPTNQVCCTGEYELVMDAGPGGQPLWKKTGGERWLYSGTDGRWYIGGVNSKHKRFECASGFIYNCKVHDGVLPHQLSGAWEWGGSSQWHKDPTIHITAVSRRDTRDIDGLSSAMSSGLSSAMSSGGSDSGSAQLPATALEEELTGKVLARQGGLSGWSFASIFFKRESMSDTSTASSGMMSGHMSAQFDYSDASSSSAWEVMRETLPPPVAARPSASPWRSPGRLVQLINEPTVVGKKTQEALEPPRILRVTSANGQRECAGEYLLVQNTQRNGQCLWRQIKGEHFLYSGLNGRWCIAGQDVKDDNFARSAGWISQTAPHGGRMPDRSLLPWQRWDGKRFLRDDGITVVAQTLPADSERVGARCLQPDRAQRIAV
mmetsp:Transcript_150538/g.419489  ORF Transcript_150538/g.419489 Transcript_150538/m.419489 type:complete len:459 (-) Transcript_150538:115-1491(-)